MKEFFIKVDKTLHHHLRNGQQRVRGIWWDMRRPLAKRPVFVVGCSRAGTTLVYKTLSESRQLASLQRETHDFWADLFPPEDREWSSHAIPPEYASADLRALVSRYFFTYAGSLDFVDKNNQNGLSVAFLHRLFPHARFVYIKRSPGDNLNSLIQGWQRADEFATWSDKLPVSVKVDQGRYQKWCFFLAEGWQQYLNSPIEDVCAFQYRTMNEAILKDKALIPDHAWVEINYEDLVRDPVAHFKKVFDALDLNFDPHLEQHCAQVLSKPYNAFSAIGLEKWRESENAERIARVLPEVSDVAQRMGYSL